MRYEERDPFFNVRKEGVMTESGISIPKVALINEDTNNILGLVSNSYEIVTNKQVDSLFKEALDDVEVVEVKDHLDATTRKWKRHIVLKEDSYNFDVLPGDTIGIMIEMFNGYDARTSFGYELMGYRYICENGMVMGKQHIFSESYAHYVNNPERLRLSIDSKLGEFKNNIDIWTQWTQIPFGREHFSNFIDSRKYIGKKVADAIKDAYEPTMNREGLEETKYGAYNVLTFLATHETKARTGSNVFCNRYKTLNHIATDLYDYEDDKALIAV